MVGEHSSTGQASLSGEIFVNDIAKIDCAVFDPSLGIVGQSWHVDVALTGDLDERNLVYDFSALKKLIRQVTKSSIDHALIIPVGSRHVHFTPSEVGESWRLEVKTRHCKTPFEWRYDCPKGATYPIRTVAVKKSVIKQELARILRHRLPSSIHRISINLREEDAEETAAFFRYTHGLVGHEGLCQRLFHGHRSRVEVHVGDERRPDLEHFVARELFDTDVHIATSKQIVEGHYEIGKRSTEDHAIVLANDGSSGMFRAVLPANKVFVIENETSVECIAATVAHAIRQRIDSRDPVRVVCYEGIDKGAAAEI